jgi:hypothetical protein
VEGGIAKVVSLDSSSRTISAEERYEILKDDKLDNTNIFLSGLGGALIGAVISSVLQHFFLKRNTSRKEHFKDIKKEVVEPLLDSISKTSELKFLIKEHPELYISSEHTIFGLQIYSRMNIEIEIKNVLWKDFFENHYPNSYTLLVESLNKYQEPKDLENTLLANIEVEITIFIDKLGESVDEIPNSKCSKGMAQIIFRRRWSQTMIRSTPYDGSVYIYFSSLKNDNIHIGPESDESTILQVRGSDSKKSIERAEVIKSRIINKIEEIVKDTSSDIDDYKNKLVIFQSSKDRLITELLRIRYSTNLRTVRYNWVMKKCILLK